MRTLAASIAASSVTPLATPDRPRTTSATTPSAWLLENDSQRTRTMRGDAACDEIRDRASRRRRVLPMPGAPVTVATSGFRSSWQSFVAGEELPELRLAADERRAGDLLALCRELGQDQRRAVVARRELVAPARQFAGGRVDQDLPALRVAGQRRRAVDDLALRPRAIDARAAGRDADLRRGPRQTQAQLDRARRLVAQRFAHAQVRDDRVAAQLRRVGAAGAQIREQTPAHGALGHRRREDRRHQARAARPRARRDVRHRSHHAERRLIDAAQALRRVGADLGHDAPQRPRHLTPRLRALLGVRVEHARQQIVEPRRRVLRHVGQARSRRRHQARQDRDRRRTDVRRPPRDHLEHRRAQRVEVGARAHLGVAARLLGRHVRRRADDRTGARELRVVGARHAEVDELGPKNFRAAGAASDEENVRGLHVAMDDPRVVRRRERLGDLGRDLQRLEQRQRLSLQALADVLALQPLHGDVRLPFVELPERHEAHDPGMREPCQHAPFAVEARLFAGVDARDRDDLERHRLPRHLIERAVHDADASAPDLALDDEPSPQQHLLGERGHGLADSLFRRSCPTRKIS